MTLTPLKTYLNKKSYRGEIKININKSINAIDFNVKMFKLSIINKG